jgi:hypothetical protein
VKGDPGKFYRVDGGKFYDLAKGEEVPPEEVPPRQPLAWICRRVEDYGFGQIPGAAAFDECSLCKAQIVYNPARADSVDAPRVCMQCAAITPEPL